MGDGSKHTSTVRREFTRQAATFDPPGSVIADVSLLGWIAAQIELPVSARILDVAGGTGQLGRHLARAGGTATIVDLTEAMLTAGMQAALDSHERNVIFVRADAAALPFPDGQFDIVVCRFALHHMDQPERVIAEMNRVCRPGGTVTLIDMLSGGAHHDELERLRDPSHTRALTLPELGGMLVATGRTPARISHRDQTIAVVPWLEKARPGAPEREAILAALTVEADGGPETGLHAARNRDELTVTMRFALIGD